MYIFLINQKSGNGKAFTKWKELQILLNDMNISYDLHKCTDNETTNQYMDKKIKSKRVKAFVVIGGDGTISSVIQKLAHTHIPLAVLPAGSGNDVCRNFNLASDIQTFVNKLLENRQITIDLLNVNGLFGITVAGIGLDAKIGKRADESFYKRWLNKINKGSSAYTIAAVMELLTFRPFLGSLRVDGEIHLQSKLWLVACGNVKKYGGGMPICPTADPQDGWIHVTALHDAHRFKVLTQLFPKLLKGKQISDKKVHYTKGKEIVIETDQPVPLVIDGETFEYSHTVITINEKALKIIKTD